MDYNVVNKNEFDDIVSVLQERGLDPRYSIEDSESDDIEYHIRSHLDIIEDIIWIVNMVEMVESDIVCAREVKNMPF